MVADPAAFRYGPFPAQVIVFVLGIEVEGAVGDFADIRDDVARLTCLAPHIPEFPENYNDAGSRTGVSCLGEVDP